MNPGTAPARRDRQTRQVRLWELAFTLVFMALFLAVGRRPVNPLAYLTVMLGGFIGTQWILLRYYQSLDERARQRFTASWMAAGLFLTNTITAILVWGLYTWLTAPPEQQDATTLSLPFWPVYLMLIGSMLAMWATNRYLRWKDGA
ncbi:hypothetical protein GCM10008956_30770 [Deinococcus arenae]|uniref:Uncharacterized protein n=1 Tax=Deinococcus arenae TaxID=1452751 RepID=A0A8H9GUF5_9DEIO|nr:hypothetical protein [Deinococcus arenae]GGM52514.1 hypothetical protein GCM10008956_30770 [Deinococcus arenae]